MKAQRRRDTSCEVQLRRLLHSRKLRYRLDIRPEPSLRRRADIVFTRAKVAVFVDGCFWHGCPQHRSWPVNNADWWREKIKRNKDRDASTTTALKENGWIVVRIWEHDDAIRAAERISTVVVNRTLRSAPSAS